MPKAFLMHYQKNQGVEISYQGSNISEEKVKDRKQVQDIQKINSDTPHFNLNTMLPEQHSMEFGIAAQITDDEDEEISVTDAEETDDEEIDDDECDEEEEDDDDEEINIDDSDCDYNVNSSNFPISSNSNDDGVKFKEILNNNNKTENSSKKYDTNIERSGKTSNNMNLIGSEHSAFSKPPVVLEGGFSSSNSGHSMKSDELSKMYPGIKPNINVDTRFPVANYWLHMNRMYPGSFPPFHPLPIGIGHPAGPLPIESNISQSELLQRQMLHSQMLYLNGQGMLPPGHPMHSIFPHGHHPGFPQLVSPIHDNIKVKSEVCESHSPAKSMPASRRKPSDPSCDNIKNSSHRAQRISTQHNESIRNLTHITKQEGHSIPLHIPHPHQLPFLPVAIPQSPLPSPVSPVSALQLTPPLPASMSPPTIFGSPAMNPLLYSNMFACGARRPRDPNKPPPVKKYKCDICSKAFSRSNTLVTHRRIHTGEKPFKCEICSRAFRQPGNLTRHRLTHTTVKPYVCVVCKKAFNRASNLHTHMRTHTTFRPFICPYCGKGFQQKVDLKIHMYTHGGVQ